MLKDMNLKEHESASWSTPQYFLASMSYNLIQTTIIFSFIGGLA